jgi:NADH:ubiquinone oxidoreductase subunit K
VIGLEHYLVLSGVLFGVGLYGALSKRNVVTVLMAIELMFNAVNIALVAMSRYLVPRALVHAPADLGGVPSLLTGQVFAVFVVTVAAAEVALGLGIVIALYRRRATVDLSQVNLMQR